MPAFSFSKQKKQPSFVRFDKQVPTVGKYNVTETKFNSRIKTAPSMSLPKASRDSSQKKMVPGPGAYQNLNTLQNSAGKGVSMKGTHSIKIKTQGPSPGQYEPKVQFPSKKFSFSKSSQKKTVAEGPDPGTYEVKYDVLNTTSNYVFAKAEREQWDKKTWMKNVGPGYHEVKEKLIIQQKNQFSFPKKEKFQEDNIQIKEKGTIPGPGKYDLSKARQSRKSVKFALAAKTMEYKTEAPGPGAYKIAMKFESGKGSAIIGNSPRSINYSTLTPGPGKYETQNMTKIKSKEAPNVVFPKQQRMRSATLSLPVGPGYYEVPSELESVLKQHKGFSIKGRTSKQKVQKTPGPQAYNPDFTKVYSSAQKSVFGKSRKLSLTVNKTPGPGTYESKQKEFSKTFYFNKAESKSQETKNGQTNVGPGQYKLKPFFGQFEGRSKIPTATQTIYV